MTSMENAQKGEAETCPTGAKSLENLEEAKDESVVDGEKLEPGVAAQNFENKNERPRIQISNLPRYCNYKQIKDLLAK